MTYRRLTRILHVLLLLAATTALSGFVVLEFKLNTEINAFHDDRIAMEKQSKDAAHTIGIILLKAAVTTDQLAKLLIAEQSYWRTQNAQMTTLFQKANETLESFNGKTLPSVTMTVENLDGAIEDFRGSTRNLMANANNNLLALRTTQENLNQTITALDIPKLGGNLNEMAVQGVVISKNTASASGHLDRIAADAQQEADKFVAPKTKWQKFKGAMGVLWRVAAFAIVKSI